MLQVGSCLRGAVGTPFVALAGCPTPAAGTEAEGDTAVSTRKDSAVEQQHSPDVGNAADNPADNSADNSAEGCSCAGVAVHALRAR